MDEIVTVQEVSYDIVRILLMMTASALSLVLVKDQWTRRHLIKSAWSVPGPKGYPLIGNAMELIGKSTKECFQTYYRWFEGHPDIFRFWIGPALGFGISKPEHIEIILNHPKCIAKGERYKFTKVFMGNGLFSAPVHIWKKNRKLINPTFNQKILNSFVEVFSRKSKSLVETLRSHVRNENLDIFPIISTCTVETVCETVMGVKTKSSANRFGELLDRMMEIVVLRMFKIEYYYDFLFKWTKAKSTLDRVNGELLKFTGDVVSEKKKMHEDNIRRIENGEVALEDDRKWKTLLDLLIELSNNGIKFTEKELRDEVNTFIAAGSDTTAGTICFCFLTLGIYQDVQDKVFREVIDVLGEDRDVVHDDLPRFPYLERFIKETMRLFPAGAIILRSPSEDIKIDDTILPKSSTIFISIYYMQRCPKYWKNPLQFDPDRFLPEEVAKRHPYSFAPFSGGPRSCIGSRYAMMIMKTLIATVVRKYRFRSSYKSIDEVVCKLNLLLRPADGFAVSLEAR